MKKQIAASLAVLLLMSACSSAAMSTAPAASASAAAPAAETSASPAASYQTISQEEAKKMMDAGGVIIVDVRRQEEYDAGHIANAILMPNETIRDEAAAKLPDKNATYLLYCRTGIRAGQAAQKLADLGYTDVYSFGGISTWPYDIVK